MQIIKRILCDIDRSAIKSENKRPIESGDDENEIEERKKLKTEDGAEQTTESILDDIHLDDIESRITVHVIETPEACTHEVAVYPGNGFVQLTVGVLTRLGSMFSALDVLWMAFCLFHFLQPFEN